MRENDIKLKTTRTNVLLDWTRVENERGKRV